MHVVPLKLVRSLELVKPFASKADAETAVTRAKHGDGLPQDINSRAYAYSVRRSTAGEPHGWIVEVNPAMQILWFLSL